MLNIQFLVSRLGAVADVERFVETVIRGRNIYNDCELDARDLAGLLVKAALKDWAKKRSESINLYALLVQILSRVKIVARSIFTKRTTPSSRWKSPSVRLCRPLELAGTCTAISPVPV